MVFQAALMAIIVLDGLAFIAFCTAIYLRKTCTPRRQKDVRWALRIAYVCMFVLGVICVATIGASPAAAAIAGVLLGNAAALMVATSSCRAASRSIRHHRRRYAAGERAAGPRGSHTARL